MLSECRYHASLQNEYVVRYHNAWVEFEHFKSDETNLDNSFSQSHQSSTFLSQNKQLFVFNYIFKLF